MAVKQSTTVRVGGKDVDLHPVQRGQVEAMSVAAKGQSPRSAAMRGRQLVNNIVATHDQGTPAEHEEGRLWYPKVHDATEKGVRQLGLDSSLHGAGIVAAVSPNMNWDTNNISAFDHIDKLANNSEHLGALNRSLANKEPDDKGHLRQARTAEFRGIVTKHYPSIATAPDSNIRKALDIRAGAHPDTVLSPRSAPKTNSFAHNIADPSATVNPHSGQSLVTVDGRAHDMASNRMFPWGMGRGIGSSATTRGGPTRYEHFANAYASAARVASAEGSRTITPSEMQARTWVTGKRIERTAPGAFSNRGPARHGQSYL